MYCLIFSTINIENGQKLGFKTLHYKPEKDPPLPINTEDGIQKIFFFLISQTKRIGTTGRRGNLISVPHHASD